MKISRENYEEYFLDYLEGNLNKELLNEFNKFLAQNPELKDELESIGIFKIQTENLSFQKKDKLFRGKYELETEFNNAAVARMEGDLSEPEKSEFEKFLKENPEKLFEAELFEKTRQIPDETIIFEKKNSLYRYTTGRKIFMWSSRIAAVLIIAFFIYRTADYFFKQDILPENSIAVSELKDSHENGNHNSVTSDNAIKKVLQPPIEPNTETIKPARQIKADFKVEADRQKIAEVRIPAELPPKIPAKNITLAANYTELSLMPVKSETSVAEENINNERLFADIVKEKTGFEKLTLGKVLTAGLNIISTVTRQKFSYETNENGRVTGLNYDSHFLAFDIPLKTDNK